MMRISNTLFVVRDQNLRLVVSHDETSFGLRLITDILRGVNNLWIKNYGKVRLIITLEELIRCQLERLSKGIFKRSNVN